MLLEYLSHVVQNRNFVTSPPLLLQLWPFYLCSLQNKHKETRKIPSQVLQWRMLLSSGNQINPPQDKIFRYWPCNDLLLSWWVSFIIRIPLFISLTSINKHCSIGWVTINNYSFFMLFLIILFFFFFFSIFFCYYLLLRKTTTKLRITQRWKYISHLYLDRTKRVTSWSMSPFSNDSSSSTCMFLKASTRVTEDLSA